MSTAISSIYGIGPLVLRVFQGAGYTTIRDLYGFNGDDMTLMRVINEMKTERPDMTNDYWRRLCTRCVNIIIRVRNRSAVPFVPDHFMCPISLELMRDPVIAPSGYSFERTEILEWLATHSTDPMTREELDVSQLYSNKYLKDAIEHYRNNFQQYNI